MDLNNPLSNRSNSKVLLLTSFFYPSTLYRHTVLVWVIVQNKCLSMGWHFAEYSEVGSYLCLEATLSGPSSLVVFSASFCCIIIQVQPLIDQNHLQLWKVDKFIPTVPYNMRSQQKDRRLLFKKKKSYSFVYL